MRNLTALILLLLVSRTLVSAEGVSGYYSYPAVHGDTIVFAAEGDLWTVAIAGGLARRLTTHPGEERHPAISSDGETVAFSATYEGSYEVFTMPIVGGLPARQTWEDEPSVVTSWTPDNRLLYATSHYSTLPDVQLVKLGLDGSYDRIQLSQASEGSYDAKGTSLYFVRPSFHGNVTKRYTGGTARRIWKFEEGAKEAHNLTPDHNGESHTPMWWQQRVYFISDRDGTMNIWSMTEDGGRFEQHTEHSGWDVRTASLQDGRIVYQVGADLWLYDIAREESSIIPITLATDVDQWRDKWINKPMDFLTSMDMHPSGESVVATARGRLFVLPVKQGRLVRVSSNPGIRYRDGVFMPDGETVMALSDESGEFEFVRLPKTGVGEQQVITSDGGTLRFRPYPSPDGKWVAYTDLNRDLWLLDLETGARKIISLNRQGVGGISWSPDSQWIAFQQNAVNSYAQIYLYGLVNGEATSVTSDRVNSWSPAWGARGDWLYFVSDRSLQSLVGSPWGARQPEPYFDKSEKIYQIALRPDVRSPFRPKDELIKPDEIKNGEAQAEEKDGTTEKPEVEKLAIDLAGIQRRVRELPAKRGNIYNLSANDGFLFWQERDSGPDAKSHLKVMQITNEKPESKTLIENVTFYDLSDDGKKILVRVEKDLYVIDAQKDAPPKLVDHKLDLGNWNFAINVREDWRQIFIDAWRMERDYFYDPGMHGVDWDAVKDRYLPLVDRVTTRLELNELIGRAVGELSVLHTATYGGDTRRGKDSVQVASLGARLRRDMNAGGYVVDYIYLSDPDYPDELSPMSDPDVDVGQGDVITTINGIDTLSVPDIGVLLRNQGGKQVRLGLRRQDRGAGEAIVSPTTNEAQLRYRDWKLNRRLLVEEQGGGRIGYVHLSAMGSANLTEWYRQFYPVFDREGLIIDVRHNRGGNIDSLILEKLLRKAWFYWKSRVGEPYWNMQYAFRGHMVVLCDQNTASDGEAFAEGFRRLGLGEVIGTRTWGGEIWLSYNNRLTDQGIASVPQSGVYSEKGEWLIEQHGVEPDIEIDNLPHATYMGEDAQLDKAIDVLLTKIKRDPRLVPEAPPYPNHKFNYRDGVE